MGRDQSEKGEDGRSNLPKEKRPYTASAQNLRAVVLSLGGATRTCLQYLLDTASKEASMHVEPKHTMAELQDAARAERNARVRDRIRGVILAKKGYHAKQVADDLGVSPRAVQDWVWWYNEGGIKNLADAPRPGQPRKCPADKFEAVKKRVLDGPKPEDKVCTLRGADVQKILEKEFGVVQKLSTTYNLLLIGIRFSSVAGGRPTSPPRNTDSLS
jgi:transposase